jgi:hypothetical protein
MAGRLCRNDEPDPKRERQGTLIIKEKEIPVPLSVVEKWTILTRV